jgi:hypothetical protein
MFQAVRKIRGFHEPMLTQNFDHDYFFELPRKKESEGVIMELRLSQSPRKTLGSETPTSKLQEVLRRPVELAAFFRRNRQKQHSIITAAIRTDALTTIGTGDSIRALSCSHR